MLEFVQSELNSFNRNFLEEVLEEVLEEKFSFNFTGLSLASDDPMILHTLLNPNLHKKHGRFCDHTWDYQLFGATPDKWMTLVKPPTYPSGDANAPYWNELRQVIRVQIARRDGDDPFTVSRWPD